MHKRERQKEVNIQCHALEQHHFTLPNIAHKYGKRIAWRMGRKCGRVGECASLRNTNHGKFGVGVWHQKGCWGLKDCVVLRLGKQRAS